MDELPTPLDPLLPRLSKRIVIQPATAAGRVGVWVSLGQATALDRPQNSPREVLPGPSGRGAVPTPAWLPQEPLGILRSGEETLTEMTK